MATGGVKPKGKTAHWGKATFLRATESPAHWPNHPAAEIAFAGRSNVGKSSLLNALVGQRGLSNVSATPGRTRQILFFSLTPKLCLVDLPGYGFAKRSKSEREQWAAHIENYLADRENLRLLVSLIDARVGPTELDLQLLAFALAHELPVLAVLTKVDKLPKSKRRNEIEKIRRKLPAEVARSALPVSSVTGEGIAELRARLDAIGASE